MVLHYITYLTTTADNSLFSLVILSYCPYWKSSLVVCDPRTVLTQTTVLGSHLA